MRDGGLLCSLGVGARVGTGSGFRRGGENDWMLSGRRPVGDFGLPFECRICRGALIFVASQGRLSRAWRRKRSWSL